MARKSKQVTKQEVRKENTFTPKQLEQLESIKEGIKAAYALCRVPTVNRKLEAVIDEFDFMLASNQG